MSKSTTQEIETRFDKEVEKYSNLNTGQSAVIDARHLYMEMKFKYYIK